MVEYGIVTSNKFHFLSDDETADPSEILEKASQIKKTKGPITKVPQTTAPAPTNIPKPEKQNPKSEKQHQPEAANKENAAAARGRGRGRGRGNGREGNRRDEVREHKREDGAEGERRERRVDGDRQRFEGDRQRFEGDRRGGRGRGRGNFTGERRPRPDGEVAPIEGEDKHDPERRTNRGRGRGGNNRGVRRDDHRDRTGVSGAPKKEGFGKGNWGTEQDELKGETEPVVIDAADAEKPTEDDNADKNDSGVEVEKEDDKPVGMTLSEWKEKNKATETESFNVRKPNDDKKLNLAPLKKTEDMGKESEEFVVLRREPREKHVDISVSFATVERGGYAERPAGRGTRGRGGNRGGGDRDRSRGGRVEQRSNHRGGNSHFNLTNDQFPAL